MSANMSTQLSVHEGLLINAAEGLVLHVTHIYLSLCLDG